MRKEKGILISLTEEELQDKFVHYRKADGRYAWWESPKFPKKLEGCKRHGAKLHYTLCFLADEVQDQVFNVGGILWKR
jgi:hypothetical protein